MRKLLFVLIIILFSSSAIADELDSSNDIWNSSSFIDNAFSGQKPVTDEQFEKTINEIKSRPKKKWFWQKTPPEVKPLSPTPQYSQYQQFNELQAVSDKINHSPTIMISTQVYDDSRNIIEPGYYKMSKKEETDGSYYLVLSQGTTTIARLKASHTNEDFKQSEINFGNAVPVQNKYIRLIYGNIDLTLEAFLEIKH